MLMKLIHNMCSDSTILQSLPHPHAGLNKLMIPANDDE